MSQSLGQPRCTARIQPGKERSEKEQKGIFVERFLSAFRGVLCFFFKKANVCVCVCVSVCFSLEGQVTVLNITILNASTAGSVRYV